MDNLAESATRVAILSALRSRVAEAYEIARNDTAEVMDAGDRKSARLGSGELGKVVKTNGSTRAKITDEQAFTKWVAQHHPDEVIQAVRQSYLNKVLADAKHYGQGVDTATGELIPGVDVVQGNPYVTVKLTDDAADLISANWDAALHHVPELPGGGA